MKKKCSFLSKINYGETKLWLNLFNVFMIIYSIRIIKVLVIDIYQNTIVNVKNWGLSEWLINYQGGFVRRGLIGDVVYHISNCLGIYPNTIVFFMALLSFCLAVFFITRIVIKKEWCWWMLPMIFFLRDVTPARKDYLIFISFLLLFYLYIKINKPIWKFIALNAVVIIASNFHEVFFVFSMPFAFLLVLFDKDLKLSKLRKILFFLPSILMFLILAMNIGDNETASLIHKSLTGVMPSNFPAEPYCSIDAIGWPPGRFRDGCIRDNFLSSDYGIPVLAIRPFLLLIIAYFTSNIVRVFNNKVSKEEHLAQCVIVYFNMFIAVFLLCTSFDDFTRLIEFWTISSLVMYMMIPSDKILESFPSIFVRVVNKWDDMLCKVLKPQKLLFVILILFLSGSTCGLNFYQAFNNSIIGPFVIKCISLIN